MTANSTENQEQKPNDKEINFRRLEEKYERKLAEAEARAANAERMAQEALNKKSTEDDEDNYSEPYVDDKRLNKKLNKFGQTTQSEIQKAMEMAKVAAKEELKQELWLEQHSDFYDVMKNHAERFAEKAPKLAANILKMPEGFERQKLVYHNIKELGIDRPEKKEPSIQEKVDANRKSPYYQPSNVGSAPYASAGDYSPAGQKNAYQKMQELKKQLRI